MSEIKNSSVKTAKPVVPKLIMPNSLSQVNQADMSMYLNQVFLVTPSPIPFSPLMLSSPGNAQSLAHIWAGMNNQLSGNLGVLPLFSNTTTTDTSSPCTVVQSSLIKDSLSELNLSTSTGNSCMSLSDFFAAMQSTSNPLMQSSNHDLQPVLQRQLSDRDAAEILVNDIPKPMLKVSKSGGSRSTSKHKKRQVKRKAKTPTKEAFVPKKLKYEEPIASSLCLSDQIADIEQYDNEGIETPAQEVATPQTLSHNMNLQDASNMMNMSFMNNPVPQSVMLTLPGVLIINQPSLTGQPIPILPKNTQGVGATSRETTSVKPKPFQEKTSALLVDKSKIITDKTKSKTATDACWSDSKKQVKRKSTVKESHDSKPFRCHYCHETFKDESNLQDHTETHTEGYCYKCEICSQVFRSSLGLQKHSEYHNDKSHNFKCSVCFRPFDDTEELERHMAMHMRKRPHRCSYCPKAFRDPGSLQKHVRVHTGEKPYSCQHCPKSFAEYSSLRKHLRTHTGEQPYKCSFCSKAFSISGNLQRHILIHTGQRPYRCKFCMKSFNNPSHLRRHVKNLHLKESDGVHDDDEESDTSPETPPMMEDEVPSTAVNNGGIDALLTACKTQSASEHVDSWISAGIKGLAKISTSTYNLGNTMQTNTAKIDSCDQVLSESDQIKKILLTLPKEETILNAGLTSAQPSTSSLPVYQSQSSSKNISVKVEES